MRWIAQWFQGGSLSLFMSRSRGEIRESKQRIPELQPIIKAFPPHNAEWKMTEFKPGVFE